MGNVLKKSQGTVQAVPQQGAVYAPFQQQPAVQQQPQYVQQQPQMVQQPVIQPQIVQQPMMQPQVVQQPMAPQQSAPYRSPFSQAQASYYPAFPSAPFMPRYSVPPPLSLPTGNNPASYYENDAFLANLTGWSVQDIERLRHEFLSYTNSYGVIDREGFRKLYVASLLNMTWEALERDAESAFRNFDINQTGALDFNEYITACSRMAREMSAEAPQTGAPYTY
ncbi:unnamed protein product [Adineta ricciae]|uniref:EF-hand domain-containing protein n=1 Tax=Adineta ricciae TaxID=249248 RepID=A0A815NJN2_ADIRI|nr:unnamed protein product [Adineta ricciae]CAF1434733.1 unnamed protein product [Adineta ricciae]